MYLYEHVFISRQDLTTYKQRLNKQYSDILKDNGESNCHEYCGWEL